MATLNKPTYVRLPPDMKAKLEAEAQRNSRTLTGEIIHRLKLSLDQQDKQPSA